MARYCAGLIPFNLSFILLLLYHQIYFFSLKSATKPLNVLIAFTRPLITEFAGNLNLKHPLAAYNIPLPHNVT